MTSARWRVGRQQRVIRAGLGPHASLRQPTAALAGRAGCSTGWGGRRRTPSRGAPAPGGCPPAAIARRTGASTAPPRSPPRRAGPAGRRHDGSVIPARVRHASSAVTGHRSVLEARGRTTSSGRSPVWLVLERGRVRTSPLACAPTSRTRRPASSLRRSAPTNPTSRSARSRAPARSGSGGRPLVFQVLVTGQASRMSNSSGGINGRAWSGGAAWVRRMPSHTVMTRAFEVGSGRPRPAWTNFSADSRRDIVPTLAPAAARSDRYAVTVEAAAGNGARSCWAHHAVKSRQSEAYPRIVFWARAAATYAASSADRGSPAASSSTTRPGSETGGRSGCELTGDEGARTWSATAGRWHGAVHRPGHQASS